MRDDDDWVGTPPEGRVSRDRARPSHWAQDFAAVRWVFGLLFVLVLLVLALALL